MTAVVFGVIVVMWAVVLIPMWLRRHDETEETRSVDRFTHAMHSLSRREAATRAKKYVVMPTRANRVRSHEVHVSGASAEGRKAPRRRPVPSATTSAERRRRTLAGLLAITALTLMLAIFLGGIAFIALNLLVDAGLVAFVLHLRTRARHAALIRPTSRPIARPMARYEADVDVERDAVEDRRAVDEGYEDEDIFEPVPVKVARPAQVLFDQTALDDIEPVIERAPAPAHAAAAAGGGVFDQDTEGDPDVAVAAAQRVATPVARKGAVAEFVFDQAEDYEPVVATARYDVHGRDLEIDIPFGEPAAETKRAASEIGARPWEPVPVPKPIYATKPAAPPRHKRAPIFDPLLPPIDTAAELDPVDDLEEILDRRWAVND